MREKITKRTQAGCGVRCATHAKQHAAHPAAFGQPCARGIARTSSREAFLKLAFDCAGSTRQGRSHSSKYSGEAIRKLFAATSRSTFLMDVIKGMLTTTRTSGLQAIVYCGAAREADPALVSCFVPAALFLAICSSRKPFLTSGASGRGEGPSCLL